MLYKVIFISVLYNVISVAKTEDDVLVIDPRDLRLFESLWKLSYHQGVDMNFRHGGPPRKNIASSNLKNVKVHIRPLKPEMRSFTTTNPPAPEVYGHVGEEDFHYYRAPQNPEGKFMKKMFSPTFLDKFFNTDTTTDGYTTGINDYGLISSNYPEKEDNFDFTTKKSSSRKTKSTFKQRLQEAIMKLAR